MQKWCALNEDPWSYACMENTFLFSCIVWHASFFGHTTDYHVFGLAGPQQYPHIRTLHDLLCL